MIPLLYIKYVHQAEMILCEVLLFYLFQSSQDDVPANTKTCSLLPAFKPFHFIKWDFLNNTEVSMFCISFG